METEREELIRKGLLTPFHKMKGFEKRVEQPGPSYRQNDSAEQTEETMEASSIAEVAQSMQQIAQNLPATKLLDAESLPRLDARYLLPTAPFQRLVFLPVQMSRKRKDEGTIPRGRTQLLGFNIIFHTWQMQTNFLICYYHV